MFLTFIEDVLVKPTASPAGGILRALVIAHAVDVFEVRQFCGQSLNKFHKTSFIIFIDLHALLC